MSSYEAGALSDSDEFTRSGGNIFADLDLPNPEALKRKATYAALIQRCVEETGASPGRVADQLGIAVDELSKILRGRFGQVGEIAFCATSRRWGMMSRSASNPGMTGAARLPSPSRVAPTDLAGNAAGMVIKRSMACASRQA